MPHPRFLLFFILSNFSKTNGGRRERGEGVNGKVGKRAAFCAPWQGSWRPRIRRRKEQWERLTVLIPATGWFFIPARCVLKSNKACKQPAESIGPNWSVPVQKALITRTLTRKTSRNFSIFLPAHPLATTFSARFLLIFLFLYFSVGFLFSDYLSCFVLSRILWFLFRIMSIAKFVSKIVCFFVEFFDEINSLNLSEISHVFVH